MQNCKGPPCLPQKGKSYHKFRVKLKSNYNKWLEGEGIDSFEKLKELDQLYFCLPKEWKNVTKFKAPKTSLEPCDLADELMLN